MLHSNAKRFVLLMAGILFVVYAFATDEQTERRTPTDDNTDDTGEDKDKAGRTSNVVDVASEAGRFGTWTLAVKQAGLTQRLEGVGPFTVFAPTDEAFGKLQEKLDELLADTAALRNTVERHIVEGRLASTDLSHGAELTTLAGNVVTISMADAIQVDESTIVDADLTAHNGVIHGIDTVLPDRTT